MLISGPALFATIHEKPYSCADKTVPVLQSFGDGHETKGRYIVASLSLLVGKVQHITSKCDLDGDDSTEEERKEISSSGGQWLKWHTEILALISETQILESFNHSQMTMSE
jgi:hypothetical protein